MTGARHVELSARIERVYVTLEKRPSAYGARSWFARKARVTPYTVTRWINEERAFQGAPLSVLEMLEERAGIVPLAPVER